MIVEDRVGGSTIIGSQEIVRAVPDGYTIGLANTSTHPVTAALMANLPFDPIKDFSPIGMVGSSPLLLLGSPVKPAKNFQDFVRLAKAQPGSLTYASAGTATPHPSRRRTCEMENRNRRCARALSRHRGVTDRSYDRAHRYGGWNHRAVARANSGRETPGLHDSG